MLTRDGFGSPDFPKSIDLVSPTAEVIELCHGQFVIGRDKRGCRSAELLLQTQFGGGLLGLALTLQDVGELAMKSSLPGRKLQGSPIKTLCIR